MTSIEDVKANFAQGWLPYLPGEGWDPILIELHDKLMAIDPEIRYLQIKEKFGELRVYLKPMRPQDEALDAVRDAVARSQETCEMCGGPGVLREGSWLRMLCDSCEERRNAHSA